MHAAYVHDALHTALQSCQLGRNVAKQFILTTNKDRDHVDASITRESIETALSELGARYIIECCRKSRVS